MADRNTNWDRERNWEPDDWRRDDWQREEAWRRGRESERSGERYREHSGGSDRPEERRPYETGRQVEWNYGRRGYSIPRGDYGPNAFNASRYDQERYGTGSRGYGTTWGGTNAYQEGRNLYQGDEGNYQQGHHSQQREYPQGLHTGKGPKGYRRSDDRIREDVCECLTRHGEVDASEVDVQVKDGEVTLTGTVPRRQDKRIAEDLAENVSGVKDVHNQLRSGSGQTQGGQQHPGQQYSGEHHMETTGAGSNRRR
jgi:osmotically-inducible protein OsmY